MPHFHADAIAMLPMLAQDTIYPISNDLFFFACMHACMHGYKPGAPSEKLSCIFIDPQLSEQGGFPI